MARTETAFPCLLRPRSLHLPLRLLCCLLPCSLSSLPLLSSCLSACCPISPSLRLFIGITWDEDKAYPAQMLRAGARATRLLPIPRATVQPFSKINETPEVGA